MNEPSSDWNFRVAFLFRYGYKIANNERIFTTAEDVVFDSQINRYFDLLGKDNIKLVSFGLRYYPLNLQRIRINFVFSPYR